MSYASDNKTEYDSIKSKWGGQLRVIGESSWPDDETMSRSIGSGPYYDGHANFRLMNKTFVSSQVYVDVQYELIYSGGDTIRNRKELAQLYPDIIEYGLILSGILDDNRNLFDLSKTIDESDDYILYHRLDRLSLTLSPNWGSVRIGRQALTWGNGLIFNPMDLFNPFPPTDFIRDYKVGEDMITIQVPTSNFGDFQFVYVSRRNPMNGNVEFDQSSLAGKLHVASGTTEYDILAAKNYKDEVIGLGITGYLRDAVWRLDTTYTFLDNNSSGDGFFSLVANMDYSWIWWGKNIYGLIEFYFNGLGSNNYSEQLTDPDIIARLARGEMFTLGRTYLSGAIEIELHPLLKGYLTLINNIADPSGIIQPRATWSMVENIELTFGANISYGGNGTEFGGFKISQTDFTYKSPNNVYIWLTYYF